MLCKIFIENNLFMKHLAVIVMGLFFFFSKATARPADFRQVSVEDGKTSFCFVADPAAKRVTLRLYRQGQGGTACKEISLKHRRGDCHWRATVNKPLTGLFYTIEVKTGGRTWGETPGVFARAAGINGQRGAIIDWQSPAVKPEGWDDDRPLLLASPADLVVYEMHHRDFSVHPSSGLRYKGKFLALTEEKAIRHLQSLGVNAVHILPSFDYASVDEAHSEIPQYNWGYDPLNYNVPEGSYATDAADPACRVREFRQMVQALHRAGIRVILDVVYNHTFDIPGSAFQRTWPDAYYRKTADGQYSNGSGCGNETASERDAMRAFILESVRHWTETYHVDGFRFDLMGCHDIATMNLVRKTLDGINPSAFIYGEGWSAGSCALPDSLLATKAHVGQMPRIAAFSDELRDALRGPFSDDTKGAFLAGLTGEEESIKYGIAGGIAHPQVDMSLVNYTHTPWAEEPTQMISYVSCHDDMCLTDRLRASIPGLSEDALIRLDLLAQTAVMTSQGVPFLLSGEEMLRTKQGVHNSYNSPDSVNRLDWTHLDRYPQVFDYYRNLIALRLHHKAFRLGDAESVRQHLEFLPMPAGVVGFRLKNLHSIDSWNNIIVILNGQTEPQEVTVPEGRYTVVGCSGIIREEGLGTMTGPAVIADGQSALILHD